MGVTVMYSMNLMIALCDITIENAALCDSTIENAALSLSLVGHP